MADWVKLDPVALGEWLGAFSSSRERGEWAFGFQAGSLGGMLRPGATKPEADGYTKGAQLRKEAKDDKDKIREKKSEAGKQGNAKRWAPRQGVAEGSHCDGFATGDGVAEVSPGEERRGEENFPKGGNGASAPPPDGTPDWKLCKAEAYRREIADHRLVVDRLEAIPADKIRPEAKVKLDQARADIRALETKIFGFGLKP